MKAVILAGGQGTRLRPLTCHLPKPMVPLVDRPCLEYIIEHLKRHGITEIFITVQYLSSVIVRHFGDGADLGVHIQYLHETTPLGTAGSLVKAKDQLDDTFLVISGDALTDFDLGEAVAFHRDRNASATLLLKTVEVPLEYGLVMTAPDGRITRFLEKPGWGEVFSDTANTGMYVLEPELLEFIPDGEVFDFSKDLFPLAMQNGLPIYGHRQERYWSDIGTLEQYRQTQYDMLEGRVDVNIAGREVSPGVYVGADVDIDPAAVLEGPAFIGSGTKVHSRASIGPCTVIGRGSRIGPNATVEQSVTWPRCYLGASSQLTGAILCSDVKLHSGVTVEERAIVGDRSELGQSSLIRSGVKVWPEKTIAAHGVVHSSVSAKSSSSTCMIGVDGITGVPNLDLTPEFAGKVAAAFASTLASGSLVTVTSDDSTYGAVLRGSITWSLLASGMRVRDGGEVLAPVARFNCHKTHSNGVHIQRLVMQEEERYHLQFFDHEGLPIAPSTKRKIESVLASEDFVRPDPRYVRRLERMGGLNEAYVNEALSRLCGDYGDQMPDAAVGYGEDGAGHGAGVARNASPSAFGERTPHRVVVGSASRLLLETATGVLEGLGVSVIPVGSSAAETISDIVQSVDADYGALLDEGGETFLLCTNQGRWTTVNEVLALLVMVSAKRGLPVALPVTATSCLEETAERLGVKPVRTKASKRAILEVGKDDGLHLGFDGVFGLAAVTEFMMQNGTSLSDVVNQVPSSYSSHVSLACPVEHKGRIMRCLLEEVRGSTLELTDGVKVMDEGGWVLVRPDAEHPSIEIISQGTSQLEAEKRIEMYRWKLARWIGYGVEKAK